MSKARPRRRQGTGTGGHAGRRSQLAQSTGSSIPRQLPRSRRGDVRSAAHATDDGSPPADRRRPLAVGRPVVLSGADLTGSTVSPAIAPKARGHPGDQVRSWARAGIVARTGATAPAAGGNGELDRRRATQATRARADLYQRIQKGGQRMPALAHLQEADINALYAYLTQLAGSPDASPQSRRTTSWARLGEHVVKGTCHICHDAVGPRPSGQALAQGTIPPFTTLLEDKPVVDFVTKVRAARPS